MTDRELLEAAAKAAGLSTRTDKSSVWIIDDDGSPIRQWNPLTDDGDAFRLAVKLQISVIQSGATRLCENKFGKYLSDEVDAEADGLSATRRAIVRAAAAIGGAK